MQEGYAAYEQALAQDVFIKDITGKPYTGQVPSMHCMPLTSVSTLNRCTWHGC